MVGSSKEQAAEHGRYELSEPPATPLPLPRVAFISGRCQLQNETQALSGLLPLMLLGRGEQGQGMKVKSCASLARHPAHQTAQLWDVTCSEGDGQHPSRWEGKTWP